MKQLVLTDLDIQALVDNADALTREERRFLMEIVAKDKILTKRYDELVRQKELLQALLTTLTNLFPLLKKLFADAAYQGPIFHDGLAGILPQLEIEIVKREEIT
jgi:hypothetical protein